MVATTENKTFEICGGCFPPYVLSVNKTSCIGFAEWASQVRSEANAACANISGCVLNNTATAVPKKKTVSYIVDPIYLDDNPNAYTVDYLIAM